MEGKACMSNIDEAIKRPRVTEDMVRKASEKVLEDMDGNIEDVIKQYSHPMDGYELSKDLERYCCWDINREEMERLDEIECNVSKLHREAEKKWFEENNIKPPFSIGSMTTLGEITGISNYSIAAYEIKLPEQDDSNGKSRRIIKFEDARLKE